ncbi:hypothetical protein [Caulobacter sp. CCH5-E12]|uniref:hypothetical protein n=1 Tax=Caulobacter sp. CCH5-E12 TaxID=1768770 RepID=UPI0007860DE4|nr:hypothetical protein [Caulobacter sp. CCH5-E12]
MSPGPWNRDDESKIDVLGRILRIIGLVLCVVGLWQLTQGFLAAQNPAIAPAASWAAPAILGGVPIGLACLALANLRRGRRRRGG